MSNKIKLQRHESETTYWIGNDANIKHTVPVNKKFESTDPADVIMALLSEFSQSEPNEKEKYKALLTEWFNTMDDSSLNINETEKIRDLIYEMF